MSGDKLAFIGGTGIGETFSKRSGTREHVVETPFGRASGPILESEIDGVTCLFLSRHGPGHHLNPSMVPYRANIFALKKLGATRIIATGATGSLREEIEPGHLVIADQVIDKTHRRVGTFFDDQIVAHVEMAEPFCAPLRSRLLETAGEAGLKVHDRGTYVCMEGPQFSTRAESMMHRQWGGDLIGMTVMPEAKLAREAEMCYALIALPTDYDCWRPHAEGADKNTLLQEIIGNMKVASEAATKLIEAVIPRIGSAEQACDCADALSMAIWSDKSGVDEAKVRALEPLIGRYFESRSD